MTQTLDRPMSSPTPPAPRAGGRLLSTGLPAALWAVCAGLLSCALPVLLVWAADSRSGAKTPAALRAAGQLWLVAHGTSLTLPGGRLGLLPIGLLALPLLLLVRAGSHAARLAAPVQVRQGLRLTAVIAVGYATAGVVVANASAAADVRPGPFSALFHTALVGFVGAGAGVLRGGGLRGRLADRLPDRLRRVAPPAFAATALLLAAGALLAGVSLALHLDRAADLARSSSPGLVGGLALLLLGIGFVPNAAVWGLSWLAGPGFAVGAGTAVSPFGTTLGAVPALPLLAALPSSSPPLWVGLLALLVPLAAGALAGLLASRRGLGLLDAGLAGPLAGVLVAVAGALSAGPAGSGRLTDVGPSAWLLGLVVAAEVGAVSVLVAWLRGRRRG